MGRLSGVPFPSLGPKLSSLTLCRLHATPSPRWQRWRKARGDGLSRTESLVGREKTQKRRTLRALAKGFDCSARVLPTRSEDTDDWPVGSKVSGVVIVCRPCDELCPYRERQDLEEKIRGGILAHKSHCPKAKISGVYLYSVCSILQMWPAFFKRAVCYRTRADQRGGLRSAH